MKPYMSLQKTLITVLVLMAAFAASAQSYKQSSRAWTEGKLELSEFVGKVDNDSDFVNLSWYWVQEPSRKKVGMTHYTWYEFHPYLDMTESWIRPTYGNAQTLNLAQTAFDLLELNARKATIDSYSSLDVDSWSLSRYYTNQFHHAFAEMQSVTRKGQDEKEMNLYATGVLLELEKTSFDPTKLPLDTSTLRADIAIGLGAALPISDYFKAAPFGFDLMLGIGVKRHMFGLDMGLHFVSEAKHDLLTHHGWIEKGEDLNEGHMLLTYGYCVNPKSSYPIYPTLGVGANFMDAVEQIKDRDKEVLMREKAGLMLAAGFICDLPVSRHVLLFSGGSRTTPFGQYQRKNYASVATRYIRLRPYLSLTQMSDGPGLFPSLHLSVMFCWSSDNLR